MVIFIRCYFYPLSFLPVVIFCYLYPLCWQNDVERVQVIDLNADGLADVVTYSRASNGAAQPIQIQINDGNGGFRPVLNGPALLISGSTNNQFVSTDLSRIRY